MKNFLNSLAGNASRTDKIPEEVENILIDNETIQSSYSLFRDYIIFTNYRLILMDKQGFTGRKKEIQSLAYQDISRFSIETAGTADMDAEIDLYISSSTQPIIQLSFGKSDEELLYEVYRTISKQKLK